MENCLFCRIIDGKTPAKIVHQDDRAVVIVDIHPQAPVHLLVIPRRHIPSLEESQAEDEALLGHLFLLAAQQARERGLDSRGYRTVINTGAGAGQSVFHLHVHLLGGRPLHWPPG
ncbi:MAG: histidine triad nucleotide-binding protein [Terriglobia bacterium]|jgi:histidine triad (HIT) family protein